MTAQTAREAATSDSTASAVQSFFTKALGQIDAGRFDVAELGEAYEKIGEDFPLVGQYLEARRAAFAEADKAGFGRGLRVLYHAGETGARVTATLYAQAAQLAASNYGAASAGAVGAANLLALAATPVGLGLAIAAAALTFAFGERPMTQAEARAWAAQFYVHRKAARELLATINDGHHTPQRWAAEQIGFLSYLEDLAGLDDDPTSFLGNGRLRSYFRALLSRAGVPWSLAPEAALMAEASKRAAKIQAAWLAGLRDGQKATRGKDLATQLKASAALLPPKARTVLAAFRAQAVKKATARVMALGKVKGVLAAVRNQGVTQGFRPLPQQRVQRLTQQQATPAAAEKPATNNDIGKLLLSLAAAAAVYKLLS